MKKAFTAALLAALSVPAALFAQTSASQQAAFKEYCQTYQADQEKQRGICEEYWQTPEYAAFYYKTYASGEDARAQRVDDSGIEQVQSFHSDIRVNADASISVTETIRYDFGDEHRHGIFRNIPTDYRTDSGSTVRLELQDVTVVDENGAPYRFQSSRSGADRVLKIGDPDAYVTGAHTYVISYVAPRAVGMFDSYDEIYWNVTGTKWNVPIRKATARVIVPGAANVKESDLSISCYFGPGGSRSSCASESASVSSGEIVGEFLQGSMAEGEGLTVALGFPKGIVAGPTATQDVGSFLKSGYWFLLMPILVFIWRYRKWSRDGRDPKSPGIITAQYESPDGLSPMQAKYLLSRAFGNSLSAEIVHLATRGYLRINKVRRESILIQGDDYELVRLKPVAGDDLPPHEKYLFEALFAPDAAAIAQLSESIDSLAQMAGGSKNPLFSTVANIVTTVAQGTKGFKARIGGDTVRLSDLKGSFYKTSDKVMKLADEGMIAAGYMPPAKSKFAANARQVNVRVAGPIIESLFFGIMLVLVGVMFLGFFIDTVFGGGLYIPFVLAWVPSVVIWAVFRALMPQLTEKGVAAKDLVKGFKLYLSVAEKDRINFHNAPEKNPQTFEKFLPYAMAFGVEKQWAKLFEGMLMPPPSWYGDSSLTSFNAGAFAGSMASFSKMSSSSLSHAPGSRGSSGSHGGGSSGGGGGGGGGGSW